VKVINEHLCYREQEEAESLEAFDVGFDDEIIPVGVPLGCTKYPWLSGNHLKTRVTVIFLDRVKLFEAHPLFLKRSMKMFCKICVNAPTT